jgi:serine/threonine-protein kinase RsbW
MIASSSISEHLGRPHLRMELVSDPMYLCGSRELISAIARRIGFAEEGAKQIALALDEALANIIRHGYDRRKDGVIWISVWPLPPLASPGLPAELHGPGIAIILEDEARQVDPSTIKSRDLDEIRPGGLGVHIIQQVMDVARYERRESAGMRLTLVKRVVESHKPAPAGKVAGA